MTYKKHKQLLIVEKDFYCAAFATEKGEIIFSDAKNTNTLIAKMQWMKL